MTAPGKKIRIGDLLVQNGVITELQLMDALETGTYSGRPGDGD